MPRVASGALLLTAALVVACTSSETIDDLPGGVQTISLLGDTLSPPPMDSAVLAERTSNLQDARALYEKDPSDLDAAIWYSRRTAYLGHYREAIAIYTGAITDHPDDPRPLRHRGHRYISLRRFDDAIADFHRAAELMAGAPDEVEPDGLPNARNQPTSTLHTNVWYHLGLAHYLEGDFEAALDAYRRCLAASANDDMRVATRHWLYMTLRRLGRDAEAAEVLAPVTPDMDIIENFGYHRLLLMYQGVLPPDSLLDLSGEELSLENATTAYGVGNWHLYNGRDEEAGRVFEAIVAGQNQWAAFGYIAAEAEVARRAEGR